MGRNLLSSSDPDHMTRLFKKSSPCFDTCLLSNENLHSDCLLEIVIEKLSTVKLQSWCVRSDARR